MAAGHGETGTDDRGAAVDPLALRDLAVRVVTEAAGLVARMRADGVEVAATKSSPVDVVTEIDRESERLVRSRLAGERPHDSVVGEEEGTVEGRGAVRWVVDPVDGTVNLLYGIPEYAVSVAAEVAGEPVAAAVADVARGVVYAAARGHGASRDGVPLRVRDVVPVEQRLVLTGFGYDADVRAHQAGCVARMLPLVRDIRRMGSCALDLCHVAEGLADGYVEEGPQHWDWAAGRLVLTEAGGRFEILPGTDPGRPDPAVLVGAPEEGFDEFVALLAQTGFLRP